MEKFRLLTRSLILNKKYLIIDEKEEVKSEISEKEREDFLEDEELSDKEILKETNENKLKNREKKESFWESSDEENNYYFSDSNQSFSYDSDKLYKNTTNPYFSKKHISYCNLGKSNSLMKNVVPKGILKKNSNKINNDDNVSPPIPTEGTNLPVKKVNFNPSKNTLNGSFLIKFKSTTRTL